MKTAIEERKINFNQMESNFDTTDHSRVVFFVSIVITFAFVTKQFITFIGLNLSHFVLVMANTREYLHHLLAKAISHPVPAHIDFRALRQLLEASIELRCDKHQSSDECDSNCVNISEILKDQVSLDLQTVQSEDEDAFSPKSIDQDEFPLENVDGTITKTVIIQKLDMVTNKLTSSISKQESLILAENVQKSDKTEPEKTPTNIEKKLTKFLSSDKDESAGEDFVVSSEENKQQIEEAEKGIVNESLKTEPVDVSDDKSNIESNENKPSQLIDGLDGKDGDDVSKIDEKVQSTSASVSKNVSPTAKIPITEKQTKEIKPSRQVSKDEQKISPQTSKIERKPTISPKIDQKSKDVSRTSPQQRSPLVAKKSDSNDGWKTPSGCNPIKASNEKKISPQSDDKKAITRSPKADQKAKDLSKTSRSSIVSKRTDSGIKTPVSRSSSKSMSSSSKISQKSSDGQSKHLKQMSNSSVNDKKGNQVSKSRSLLGKQQQAAKNKVINVISNDQMDPKQEKIIALTDIETVNDLSMTLTLPKNIICSDGKESEFVFEIKAPDSNQIEKIKSSEKTSSDDKNQTKAMDPDQEKIIASTDINQSECTEVIGKENEVNDGKANIKSIDNDAQLNTIIDNLDGKDEKILLKIQMPTDGICESTEESKIEVSTITDEGEVISTSFEPSRQVSEDVNKISPQTDGKTADGLQLTSPTTGERNPDDLSKTDSVPATDSNNEKTVSSPDNAQTASNDGRLKDETKAEIIETSAQQKSGKDGEKVAQSNDNKPQELSKDETKSDGAVKKDGEISTESAENQAKDSVKGQNTSAEASPSGQKSPGGTSKSNHESIGKDGKISTETADKPTSDNSKDVSASEMSPNKAKNQAKDSTKGQKASAAASPRSKKSPGGTEKSSQEVSPNKINSQKGSAVNSQKTSKTVSPRGKVSSSGTKKDNESPRSGAKNSKTGSRTDSPRSNDSSSRMSKHNSSPRFRADSKIGSQLKSIDEEMAKLQSKPGNMEGASPETKRKMEALHKMAKRLQAESNMMKIMEKTSNKNAGKAFKKQAEKQRGKKMESSSEPSATRSKLKQFKKNFKQYEQCLSETMGAKEPMTNEEVARCGCNALNNFNRCVTRKPIICFCFCSFTKGTDGGTYHTLCNCCESVD